MAINSDMATRYRFGDNTKNLISSHLRGGLVTFASHYKYSSAVDYYEDRAGLLKIELL